MKIMQPDGSVLITRRNVLPAASFRNFKGRYFNLNLLGDETFPDPPFNPAIAMSAFLKNGHLYDYYYPAADVAEADAKAFICDHGLPITSVWGGYYYNAVVRPTTKLKVFVL